MKTSESVLAILLLATTASCSGASANPLIGSWKPDSSVTQKDYCNAPMTFTAKTYTALDPWGKALLLPMLIVFLLAL